MGNLHLVRERGSCHRETVKERLFEKDLFGQFSTALGRRMQITMEKVALEIDQEIEEIIKRTQNDVEFTLSLKGLNAAQIRQRERFLAEIQLLHSKAKTAGQMSASE